MTMTMTMMMEDQASRDKDQGSKRESLYIGINAQNLQKWMLPWGSPSTSSLWELLSELTSSAILFVWCMQDCTGGYLQLARYVDFSLQQMQSAQSHTDVIRGIAGKTSISPISKVFPKSSFHVPLLLLAQIAPVNRALCFYGGMLSYQILAIKHFQENSAKFCQNQSNTKAKANHQCQASYLHFSLLNCMELYHIFSTPSCMTDLCWVAFSSIDTAILCDTVSKMINVTGWKLERKKKDF